MREYDHHAPDYNVDTWAEDATTAAEFYAEMQAEERAIICIK